jgi:hypothetical protein
VLRIQLLEAQRAGRIGYIHWKGELPHDLPLQNAYYYKQKIKKICLVKL